MQQPPPTAAKVPSPLVLVPTGVPFELKRNGATITGRTWGTVAECHSAIVLVHGLGAHSGWFEAIARRLKVRGVYTVAYDQLGFGRRRDQKFLSSQQWLDDVHTVYGYVKEQMGNKPVFLGGNSMGAVVALAGVPGISPSGLVLFSPGFEGHKNAFTLSFRIKAIAQALLRPDTEICVPYSTETVSRDELVRNWINADTEKRFNVPGRMLLELLKLTRRLPKSYKQIHVPVIMMTSGQDKVVDTAVANLAFDAFGPSKKTKLHYEDAWHDLMFDPVLDEAVDALVRWMDDTANPPI
jgi:alpha-beta hydrolase superfamily lysophospholipase